MLSSALQEELDEIFEVAHSNHDALRNALKAVLSQSLRGGKIDGKPGRRAPTHEVLPVSRFNKLRAIGSTVDDVMSPDFTVDVKAKVFIDPADPGYRWSHEMASPRSKLYDLRADRLSREMHRDLFKATDGSFARQVSREEAVTAIGAAQGRWLANPEFLPRGFRSER